MSLSLSPLLPPPPRHLPHRHHRPLLAPPLRVTFHKMITEDIPFIADYLAFDFGFSFDRALKLSTHAHLAPIKSSDQPDSVVRFLRDTGMSDSQIKALISFDPLFLSYSVHKTLQPRARKLFSAGFTGEMLVELIRQNPSLFALQNPIPQLHFWRQFLGNDEDLLKVIRRNRGLFNCDIEGYVVPRLNLFREYGLPNQQIASLLLRSRLMARSLDHLRWVLEKTQQIGFEPGSRMFLEGIIAVGTCTQITLNRKTELFKMSYGWSEDEIYSAFRKYPKTLTYSEERIRSHMDFLTRKAMLDPRSVACQPMLLGYSMERNLVPRHHVLAMLKAHGVKKEYKLLTACVLSEKRFLEKCVVPHEKNVPGLREAYAAAACSGKGKSSP